MPLHQVCINLLGNTNQSSQHCQACCPTTGKSRLYYQKNKYLVHVELIPKALQSIEQNPPDRNWIQKILLFQTLY